jgi:hypothetical protein
VKNILDLYYVIKIIVMIYDVEVRADILEMEAEVVEEMNSLKTFEFEYYGWLPSYGDFDQEWETIHAHSEEEATKMFYSTKRWIKYGPSIKQIV